MSAFPSKFWEQLPLGNGVTLLTHDANGLAAFSKPEGVLSHPNMESEVPRALLTVPYSIKDESFNWTPADVPGAAPRRLYLLNRLDSATSGVILATANEALATYMRELFLKKDIRKLYQAVVFGKPSEASQLWRDRLSVQKRRAKIRVGVGNAATGAAKASESRMTVIRQRRDVVPPLALLQLEPLTGRSHQLRVQCAGRNLPIVGDLTYGDFPANKQFAKTTGHKRLFLHSYQTTFDYEWQGKKFNFTATAPLPEEFAQLL
ncbi:RluA family pseudouridine synthase [Rariglobus hedericola]|uniref:RNA pseudouridine synthase n=1 Tax=Rariglobus hedericola TaxID=2597822 RepID=A0A556QN88_9BACT|nr:RNA pseudouridine synthase [Rariglobus hedericola]TSJ78118.1 RNA pseudouridine synthase [Rariglobus hedericola]